MRQCPQRHSYHCPPDQKLAPPLRDALGATPSIGESLPSVPQANVGTAPEMADQKKADQ
jgi:hypothetical protein